MKKKVDIIIPAYKCKNTLGRTLASIAMQTYAPYIQVTIVNDASPEGSYSSIINNFTSMLDIEEIIMEENKGPGVARQLGLEKTNAPCVMFIDADDTLVNAFALQNMVEGLIEQRACAVYGDFYVEDEGGKLRDSNRRNMGLHGKIYSRVFLRRYNIHFNNRYLYEDAFFQCSADFHIQRLNLPLLQFEDKVLVYHKSNDGLTKSIPDDKYSITMMRAWTENMEELLQTLDSEKLFDLIDFKVACFLELYIDYNYAITVKPDIVEELESVIHHFCNAILKGIELPKDMVEGLYIEILKSDAISLVGGSDIKEVVPPVITFEQFKNKFLGD